MTRNRVWLGAPSLEQIVESPKVPGPDTARRAHRATLGAGWFAHSHVPGQGGRFDLRLPSRGTLYCANDDEAAVRENLGERYAGRVYLAASDLAHLTVSEVDLRGAGLGDVLADTITARTVTREIATMTDYAITQAWADAFAQHEYDGIRYEPRSTPGPAHRGLCRVRSRGCRGSAESAGARLANPTRPTRVGVHALSRGTIHPAVKPFLWPASVGCGS